MRTRPADHRPETTQAHLRQAIAPFASSRVTQTLMGGPMPVDDVMNAFCDHGRVERQTHQEGPLTGLTFAVKDFFDVAEVPTGAGSPEWLATHAVPKNSAPAVTGLLDSGARLIGKPHTDEKPGSRSGWNSR